MGERLCGTILKAPQVEADRSITFLFCADTAHHDLKVLGGLLVIGSEGKASKRDLGALLQVSYRIDSHLIVSLVLVFTRLTAALLILGTTSETGPARISLSFYKAFLDAFLILNRRAWTAEDQTVNTRLAQHDVSDHFALVHLPVPLCIELQI